MDSNTDAKPSKLKKTSIYFMGFSYIAVGISHFLNPHFFLAIMPPFLPFHLELVYLSGFFEVLIGTLLLVEKYRKPAAWALILLLIAVYPANIYLAYDETAQQALKISSFMASWVRLPIQFIFIGIAYWHTK